MNPAQPKSEETQIRRAPSEPDRPFWQHPYVIYIGLTCLLFGFLMLMGFLALENDWIPKR
jgi:hypothetical protein